MDPQNDLKFLRLKSTKCEIMVAPYPDFRWALDGIQYGAWASSGGSVWSALLGLAPFDSS